MLFCISFSLIARILVKTEPHVYGFFLLAPALICFYLFFIDLFPSFFEKATGANHRTEKAFRVLLAIFFIFVAFPLAKNNVTQYRLRNFVVSSDQGKMRLFNDDMTMKIVEAINFLWHNTPVDSTAVVLPEGVSINFFSHRDNPTRYYTFLPSEIATIGEEKIIQQLDAHEVDYILFLSRETSEYGYPFFGVHYAKEIYGWIEEHYYLLRTIGPYPFTSESGEFGIAIFKKK